MAKSSPASEIDEYLHVLFLRSNGELSLPTNPVREVEMVAALEGLLRKDLEAYAAHDLTDLNSLAEYIFSQLVRAEAVSPFEVKFAGKYFFYNQSAYGNYRVGILRNSTISTAADLIGSRFWSDVFAGFAAGQEEAGEGMPSMGFALASNRIVTFRDNEVADLEVQTTAIIEAVEEQNQIADVGGLRELILGQLRAGRELIRAGTVRAYLLHLTLLESLRFLATRYEKELIGGLAATLLAALAKHLGVGG